MNVRRDLWQCRIGDKRFHAHSCKVRAHSPHFFKFLLAFFRSRHWRGRLDGRMQRKIRRGHGRDQDKSNASQ